MNHSPLFRETATLSIILLMTCWVPTLALSQIQALEQTPPVASLRSAEDLQRDRQSQPQAVMDFVGVQPGWMVLDLFAGDGYYSQLLAHRVGPRGRVYLHNNYGSIRSMTRLAQRINTLSGSQMQVYTREIQDINLASNSLDLVWMVKVYHDLYFLQSGWSVKPGPVFRTIHRILKPGGILAVIDHHARAGAGADDAQHLHRIEAAFAIKDIESRGFTLDKTTNLLLRPDDALHRSVFDPAVRGQTSRFVLVFTK